MAKREIRNPNIEIRNKFKMRNSNVQNQERIRNLEPRIARKTGLKPQMNADKHGLIFTTKRTKIAKILEKIYSILIKGTCI